jgi:hypothetical protein
VPLVLDLRIAHDRFGSSSNPDLNGKLHCPHDMDKSLNETTPDKIRKYRADYNNNPNSISFIPAITSTSGRLHSEFIRILFLQTHRETDCFFAGSGVQSEESNMGVFFHFRRAAFSSMLKSLVSSILAKAAALRINLNRDGAPITSKSHTHPSYSQTSRLLTTSIFRCSSSTTNPVYVRRVNSLVLIGSLSSHRHSYVHLIFSSRFIDS